MTHHNAFEARPGKDRRIAALAMTLVFTAAALAAVPVDAVEDLDPVLPVPLVDFGDDAVRFEKNAGQYPAHVEYLVHGAGLNAFLTKTGATFVLYTDAPLEETDPDVPPTGITEVGVNAGLPGASVQTGYAVQLTFQGADPNAAFTAADALTTVSHHYVGAPSSWRANVAHYEAVTQTDIWPGIDVKWHSDDEGGLKFDFIVDAGADPNAISFQALGAATHTDTHGNLVMETPLGNLVKDAPFVYQETGGTKNQIPASYHVALDGSVSFDVGGYNTTKPLVIDPVIYAAYIGGSRGEWSASLALDGDGNAYVSGVTHSTDFPTTAGVIGPAGSANAFVAKFSPTGSLLYTTLVGGNNDEYAQDIAVDAAGRPHFVGWTWSADYPTTSGAYQETASSFFIGYATKLNADGTLAYSTYLGGSSGQGDLKGIDVEDGYMYVVGQTMDDTFPSTSGAYQEEKLFGHAGVVAKIDPAGNGASDLVYSTFLRRESGGSNTVAQDLVVDGGRVIVTGETAAPGFPASFPDWKHPDTGTWGTWAVFVAKLNTAGSGLDYSVVFGGAGTRDLARGIAMHGDGSLFVGGYTASTGFRNTAPGSWPGGSYSGFLVKMVANPTNANVLEYSRYVGGNGNDYVEDVAVSWNGTAHAAGTTHSTDWPATNAFPGTTQSTPVAFLTSYDAVGGGEISKSIGGWSADNGEAVETSTYGGPFVAGNSASSNLPSDFGTKPGTTDVFIVRFEEPVKTYVDGVVPKVYDWTNVVPTMGGLTWKDDGVGLEPDPEFSVGTSPGGTDVAGWAAVPDSTAGCPASWAPSSWQPSPLDQGVNYVNVRVEDCLLRATTTDGAYVIKYDTTLPVDPGAPVFIPWTNTVPTLPDFTWIDAHSGIDSVEYRIDPQPWTTVVSGLGGEPAWMSWTGGPTLDSAYVAQGLNEVEMRVCDYAGNCRVQVQYVFQFDDVADATTGLLARQGTGGSLIPAVTWQSWNEPRYEWSASSTSPILGYSYTLDTDPLASPDASIDTSDAWVDLVGSPLVDGKWHFKIRALDEAGNVGPVASLEIWIDATAPSVPTIASPTHASMADYYNLTSFSASWSATDAGGSGIKGYYHELQSGTTCSTPSGTLTTATSATFSISATFDEQVLCVMAEDNAGNQGPIGAYLVLTDRVLPTFTSLSPAPGSLHNDTRVPIEVFFEDTDGGADPSSAATWVDGDWSRVNFTVNGEDIEVKWKECKPPLGTLYGTACRLELDASRLLFEPPDAWPTGNMTVNLTIQDTALGPDNNATTSWVFEVDPTWDPTTHAALCASENPFIWSDGYCDSSGRYHPPPDDAACRDGITPPPC